MLGGVDDIQSSRAVCVWRVCVRVRDGVMMMSLAGVEMGPSSRLLLSARVEVEGVSKHMVWTRGAGGGGLWCVCMQKAVINA